MKASFTEGLTSPEVEIMEGGAITDSKMRFADLKAMLDSNRDNLKMDAMKRIINLVARGRDVSELFPAVVKNVAARNLELKKLVYVYLDPNQLIRASALRVLSSIRVPMIAPIMLLAIRESVRDMSAYVRKVAAHAIPKLYSLDESLQDELIECIDYLLGDKRTLVLGSAVYAFEKICPHRMDLLHAHYRSLCKALADVDEWGQIVMVGLLTRYARSQFIAPVHSNSMDPDLSLLLSSSRPLLQSRNCAVVLAVAQLLYYCGLTSLHPIISKALIRLLRGPREVQVVALMNIATICSTSPDLFEPYLKSFFVRPNDPRQIKLLKLQVLTSLISPTNVQLVLRELQTYVSIDDFADAAIEAIGQCALRVGTVADSCLSGLITFIASSNENVVSAAVVVLKRLLHMDAPLPLLTRLLRLIDSIKAPQARACVVWLVATHVKKMKMLAPDLLRIMAKNFIHEKAVVKLQIISLAAKLYLIDKENCELLVHYVLQLARYDPSYDVRDRRRFIYNLLFGNSKLSAHALDIFMTAKPSPVMQNTFKDREQFQLGTLSHFLNQRCNRYIDLPNFPEVAPDPSLRRDSEKQSDVVTTGLLHGDGNENVDGSFYSGDSFEEHEEEGEENDDSNECEDEEEEEDGTDNDDDGEEDESDDDSGDDEEEEEEEDEEDERESRNGTRSDDENDGEAEDAIKNSKRDDGSNSLEGYSGKVIEDCSSKQNSTVSKNLDLLLDLNFECIPISTASSYATTSARFVDDKFKLLLSHATWTVGVSVQARFLREPSEYSSQMTTVMLRFVNMSGTTSPELIATPLNAAATPTSGKFIIHSLEPKQVHTERIHVDFGDSKKASEWQLSSAVVNSVENKFEVEAPMGEQLEPIVMNEEKFVNLASGLNGMNECTLSLGRKLSPEDLFHIANCASIDCSQAYYCAQTKSRKQIVLIILRNEQVTVHSENIVLGSILCTDISNFSNSSV
uniref:AP-3 complex subunit beta n=1 Tax=Syphacia muris TaxID=451379 RepID=A0A158R5Y3_9BILA